MEKYLKLLVERWKAKTPKLAKLLIRISLVLQVMVASLIATLVQYQVNVPTILFYIGGILTALSVGLKFTKEDNTENGGN